MTSDAGDRYWSIEACGWVASRTGGDALATPWSGHALSALGGRPPRDGWDVVGCVPEVPGMPGQRAGVDAREAAER